MSRRDQLEREDIEDDDWFSSSRIDRAIEDEFPEAIDFEEDTHRRHMDLVTKLNTIESMVRELVKMHKTDA